MAFAATDSTTEGRKYSVGPLNAQVLTWTALSGDTTATITCDRLYLAQNILIDGGLTLTAAPTFSNNVVTLAFADPAASVFGTMIVYGK